jgi:hypothetical protein
LGDGAEVVAIWVRLDQLTAGDDEPLAGADDPGSGEQAVAEDRCELVDVSPAVSTSRPATAPAAKVRALSAA